MKKLNYLYSQSMRDLIDDINNASIEKNDIVTIMKVDDIYMVLYYQ